GIFPRLFHLWSHNVRPSRPRRLLQQLSYRLHAPRHRVVVPSRSLPGGCALYLLAQQKVLRRFSRSEEHTSELQSRFDLVCRLLLATLCICTLSLHDALPIWDISSAVSSVVS